MINNNILYYGKLYKPYAKIGKRKDIDINDFRDIFLGHASLMYVIYIYTKRSVAKI